MKISFLVLLASLLAAYTHAQKISISDTSSRLLQEVTISSKYNHSYQITQPSNTLKLSRALLLVPQNIQQINQSVIHDQQATSVNESVTRNVSGAIRNNTADFYGPMIIMRGAGIGTLRNGMDVSMAYYGPMPEDASIIDRIEFIKGPAGFANPIGDPAGSYNVVTKKPSGIQANRISLTAGSFDMYRLSADFEGHFDGNNKWLYRLNVAGQKARSFQKFAFNDKVIVQPVIRYNFNNKSSLNAEFLYNRQSFQQYLVTVFSPSGFGSLPTDFSISDPNKTPAKANETNSYLTYQLRLRGIWQLTAKAVYTTGHLDGDYFLVSSHNPATPKLIQRKLTYEQFNTRVGAVQAYVTGQLQTRQLTHQLLASLDYNRKDFLGYGGYNDPTADPTLYPLDALNPVYGIKINSPKKTGDLSDFATNQHRIQYATSYFQDELSMFENKLRVTLAARLTLSKSSILLPRQSSVSDLVLTPRAGISYSIMKDFSVYTLLDHTYTPQSGLNTDGGIFKPLRGRNMEAGLKKEWDGGKWSTSVSYYDITRDNIIVANPANPRELSQLGQTRSKGFEFDLKGEVITGLNVVINHAYTDSYISKDANPNYIGIVTPYLAKHIQNTWLNYKLPIQKLKGFTISAGYQFQAGRNGRYPQDPPVHIANLFRADAGLGWSNGRIGINGIVNNVFNRFNYGSTWTRPQGLYAYVPFAPREYRVTVDYSF
jgi:iron complex outermembrane receptor protein